MQVDRRPSGLSICPNSVAVGLAKFRPAYSAILIRLALHPSEVERIPGDAGQTSRFGFLKLPSSTPGREKEKENQTSKERSTVAAMPFKAVRRNARGEIALTAAEI